MRTPVRLLVLGLSVLAAARPLPAAAAEEAPSPPVNRWEGQVQAYERQDAESPPPEGAVLFVGSSSVRMWQTLADDFKPLRVLGRGIGGSQIADQVHYAERLVIRYKPAQVVFYAGDNDVWAGRKAEQVLADFQAFVTKVRGALLKAPIHFIAIKPSPSREKVWPEARKANDLVRRWCEARPALFFIDVATPMLGTDGKPRADLFLKDMLHLNRAGYEVWIPPVKASLEKAAAPVEAAR